MFWWAINLFLHLRIVESEACHLNVLLLSLCMFFFFENCDTWQLWSFTLLSSLMLCEISRFCTNFFRWRVYSWWLNKMYMFMNAGPLRHKFLRSLLPFWSSSLPILPVTAPPRKDASHADTAESRARHNKPSRMDPRKLLLIIAIMWVLLLWCQYALYKCY